MRSALGRARRLVTLLLLAVSAWYLFLRRRVAALPVAGQPDAGPVPAGRADELGAPGELPDDVLATDAGLTELPDSAGGTPAVHPPVGIVVVDDVRVGEILAEGPTGEPELIEVVEETITIAEVDLTDPTDSGAADALAAPDTAGAPGAGSDAPEVAGPADVPAPAVAAGVVAPTGVTDEPTEQFAPGIEDGIEEPTSEIPRPTFAETPSPAFSDAPTMEMPVLMDDLRAVRGIGPSMERMLHGLGIVSFRQLALLDGADLERVRHELRDFRSRIEREDWIGQARQLHKSKYGTDPV